jgi:hypothetical protein
MVNNTAVSVKTVACEYVFCIRAAQGRAQWQVLSNTVVSLHVL